MPPTRRHISTFMWCAWTFSVPQVRCKRSAAAQLLLPDGNEYNHACWVCYRPPAAALGHSSSERATNVRRAALSLEVRSLQHCCCACCCIHVHPTASLFQPVPLF